MVFLLWQPNQHNTVIHTIEKTGRIIIFTDDAWMTLESQRKATENE